MSEAESFQRTSPEYKLGSEVSFGSAGVGACYTREGFAPPKPWGAWTLGEKARLELPVRAGAPKSLHITYMLYLGGKGKPAASTVQFDGLELGALSNQPQRWGEIFTAEFALPGRKVRNRALEIEFRVSGYRAEADATAQDARPIGLGLISLTVEGRPPAAARGERGKRTGAAPGHGPERG